MFIFPNDAITYNIDNPSNGATLLSAVNYLRTILYAHLSCRNNTAGVDNHIRIGASGSDFVIDSEYNKEISVFSTETIPLNTAVVFTESVTDHCQVEIIYIPRLLASSTPELVQVNNFRLATSTTILNPATSTTILNPVLTVNDISTTSATTTISLASTTLEVTPTNINPIIWGMGLIMFIMAFGLIFNAMKKDDRNI